MADEQHLKSEADALDRMFGSTVGATPTLFPAVDNITKELTGFAGHLTNVQASQIVKYHCDPIDGDEVVEADRRHSVGLMEDSTAATFTGEEEFNRAADHGISTLCSPVKHVTTLTSCTCQFPLCWRLPCRHIFRRLFQSTDQWQAVMVRKRCFIPAA